MSLPGFVIQRYTSWLTNGKLVVVAVHLFYRLLAPGYPHLSDLPDSCYIS
jgi:hypothetical protein